MIDKDELRRIELPVSAMLWLANGEHGMSSEAMFVVIASKGTIIGERSYPHDPDDFQRCEKLLRQVPEFRNNLEFVDSLSIEWLRLRQRWSEIVDMFELEAPGIFDGSIRNYRAMGTYSLMRRVMAGGAN